MAKKKEKTLTPEQEELLNDEHVDKDVNDDPEEEDE